MRRRIVMRELYEQYSAYVAGAVQCSSDASTELLVTCEGNTKAGAQ
jgi:hypothetical protein